MWDPVWESVFRSQTWGQYPGEEQIRFVARNFYRVPDRSAIRILEVGCGPGANIWYLAREGFSFTGIDGSETAIAQARERLDREFPGWQMRGELHVGDIESLPYPDASFDAVMDIEALSCNDFATSIRIYDEMARIVKPGGKLYSRTFTPNTWGADTGEQAGVNCRYPAVGPLMGKGFIRFTALEDIPDLIRGFTIQSVERISWTAEARQREVSEWIILGEKPGMPHSPS